jgi:hypothetical protein
VLGILDPALAREVERTFLADLSRSTEIRLDQWRGRGVVARAFERLGVLFAEQF